MKVERDGKEYFTFKDDDGETCYMLLSREENSEQVLATAVHGNEEIRLIRKVFRNREYLDLRKFRGTGEDAKPTTKGFIGELDVWKQIAPTIRAIFPE